MSKLPKHFYCIDTGPYPLQCVFAPNARAFARAVKYFDVKPDVEREMPTSTGCVTQYRPEHRKKGYDNVCIITIDLTQDVTAHQVAGLVAHEACHVFQILAQAIGERDPCWEFEAYTVQSVVQGVMSAIESYQKECAK